jgi:hypothetical protein
VSAQAESAAAGADRTDAYRSAQRKLQEALDAFNKAGVDVRAYKHATDLATQARDQFASAAEEARRQKAMRPPAPQPKPAVVQPQPQPAIVIPFSPAPQPQPAPPAQQEKPKPVVVEPQPPVESEALVSARLAVQQYKRRLIELKLPVKEAEYFERKLGANPSADAIALVTKQVGDQARELEEWAAKPKPAPKPEDLRPALESAFRAFAVGDFTASESMLTRILDTHASGEAFLLRGCARYTRAMLSRNGDPVLAAAAEDFRAALKLNGELRIDTSAFSPKLVKFFDDVKNAR